MLMLIYAAVGVAVAVVFVVVIVANDEDLKDNADLGLATVFSLVAGLLWPVSLGGLVLWGIAKYTHRRVKQHRNTKKQEHEELRRNYNELLTKASALEEQLARVQAEGKYR